MALTRAYGGRKVQPTGRETPRARLPFFLPGHRGDAAFAQVGQQMSERISARISAAIRDQRESQGITRDELAAAVREAGAPDSFTTAALRNVESGRRDTSVDELVWLAVALRVSVRDLLGEHVDLFRPEDRPPDCGPVESATRDAVDDLDNLAGHQLALAESGYALARQLDAGAGMAAAAVAKELRATLKEIWDLAPPEAEKEDELGPE